VFPKWITVISLILWDLNGHSHHFHSIFTGLGAYCSQELPKESGQETQMPTSTISYLWRDPGAARTFQTGVSLHSHTNQSQETLDFVADWGSAI
jgi:hypothetical protein